MTAKVKANHQSPENNQKVGRNVGGLDKEGYKKLLEIKQNRQDTQPKSDAAKLLELLQSVDVDTLETALGAIQTAKEVSPKNDDEGYKFYKNKTLVYEDRDAFIYQRPDRKKQTWYFRIYDDARKKPVVKSAELTLAG